jgi:hypothetical protein
MGQYISYLRDFDKFYNLVRREVLYNILTKFWILKELVRLIKMCMIETYSKIRIRGNLLEAIPIPNGLNKEMINHHCFYILL